MTTSFPETKWVTSYTQVLVLYVCMPFVIQCTKYEDKASLPAGDPTPLVSQGEQAWTVGKAGAAFNWPGKVTSAAEELSTADFYATGLIGEAAMEPPTEKSYRLLIQEPNAAEIFLSLYYARNTTNEGRMQALRGLWLVDPIAYEEIAVEVSGSKVLVETMHGCLVSWVPAGEVLDEIESEYPY